MFRNSLRNVYFMGGEYYFATQLSNNVFSRVTHVIIGSLMSTFCYVYQPFYLALMTYHFFRIREIDLKFSTKYASCLSASLTYFLWFFKKGVLAELNKALENHIKTFHENEDHKKGMPRASLYAIYASGCFVFSVLIIYLTSQLENHQHDSSTDAWVESLSLGTWNTSQLSHAFKWRIVVWDSLFYTAGTVGSGTMIPIVYVFHCNTFSCYLDKAAKMVEGKVKASETFGSNRPDHNLNRTEILHLRKLFKSGKHIIRLCDQIYSTVFLMWYGVSLIALCQGTTEVINDAANISPLKVGTYFVIYGQTFIWISAVSFSSAKIPEKIAASQLFVEELTIHYFDIPCNVYGELNILLHQLNSEPKGITVGRCFLITKSFFLSYMGVALTYIIIVIQITPNLLEEFQKQTLTVG